MNDSDEDVRASERLGELASHKTVLLETRKRDGTWVATPVSLVADGERAYFRTYDAAGKAKRLRNFQQVRVAPSTLRGKPVCPAIDGRARMLHGAEADHARSLLAARYPVLHGWLVPMMHRRKGWTTEHYELTVAA
ncbi:MAG TPA: PPOX class F420-dependent oxidoreductase [Streptosporangiaceae bacterium]|nr:PPOX class F420-dependent oxidoreductase [Streptosporangiaceae bacterium]